MTDQITLEREMSEMGAARTKKRNSEAKAKSRETLSVAGGRLLRELPRHVVEAIDAWCVTAASCPGRRHKALEHISSLPSGLIASLALKVVLDAVSLRQNYTAVAMRVGGRIQDELLYRLFKEQNLIQFERALRRSEDYTAYEERRRHILRAMALFSQKAERWDLAEQLAVGTVLLELIIESTGLFRAYKVKSHGRDQWVLEPTEDALSWIEQENQTGAMLRPLLMPFVAEPLDWVDAFSGGFYELRERSSLVKTYDRAVLRELRELHVGPEVLDSVNLLQRTRWRVNPETWEMFAYLWENGLPAEGLPLREPIAIPPKPSDLETNEIARREWRKAARSVYDANHRRQSDRLFAAKIHWVAKRYLDRDFWFAWQLDWRGRAYPVSYYLHPQGGDLVKSLLLFADAKPVKTDGAKMWHAIHGANCWGLDKRPIEERLTWVNDNTDLVSRVASDPLLHRDWEQADSPWQFLAWCLDAQKLRDNPEHLSGLPIYQDATQSGIQIYSLLLRDEVGAASTNCLPCEKPQDLYGKVADETVRLVTQEAENGSEIAAKWLLFGFDRSAAKRPVMTRVYNATRHSAMRYVREWVEERAAAEDMPIPTMSDGTSGIWWLTSKLWEGMASVIRSTEVLQTWFGEVAAMFAAKNKPIRWVTPVGFPVRQYYPKWVGQTVKTSIGEKYRQLWIREPGTEIEPRRMRSAFAPNVIHSLDAAAMMKTAVRIRNLGVTSFAAIHDSYGTVAADSETLSTEIREAYIEIFQPDQLTAFRDHLQSQIDTFLPPLPRYGALDVEQIRNSLYFFN